MVVLEWFSCEGITSHSEFFTHFGLFYFIFSNSDACCTIGYKSRSVYGNRGSVFVTGAHQQSAVHRVMTLAVIILIIALLLSVWALTSHSIIPIFKWLMVGTDNQVNNFFKCSSSSAGVPHATKICIKLSKSFHISNITLSAEIWQWKKLLGLIQADYTEGACTCSDCLFKFMKIKFIQKTPCKLNK